MDKPTGRSLAKRIRLTLLGVGVLWLLYIVGGPIRSGALFLLVPNLTRSISHDLPIDYAPFHKGYVNEQTGLYVREDEDLVLRGTPPLMYRRTYLSRYRVSKQFGIGTTHDGEMYVIGDPQRFQWAALIQADGSRIKFDRTSGGASVWNAMYRHGQSPTEWYGSRLGWTGSKWALRRPDGELLVFQGCGPGIADSCSLVERRDFDNHSIDYQRDRSGRLVRMSSSERWIAFEYDTRNRVTRASSNAGRDVRYAYDAGGRLATVTESSGAVRHYTYTDQDLMATIAEPGRSIENFYDSAGRCVRQVNHFPDSPIPYVFEFNYLIKDGRVVGSEESESDGTWKGLAYDKDLYPTVEVMGAEGHSPLTFRFERDSISKAVTSLSVTCADRTGQQLSHSSDVGPRGEEWTKWDLVQMYCTEGRWRRKP
jgi:YD repeat-containing protein